VVDLKYIVILAMSFFMSGCSLFGGKRVAEVVPSCFSEGDNQTTYCKAQRVNEENRNVVTRCIGSQNQEAKPALRGKCVEKICSEGSNTDCHVRGEIAVLDQYAELVTANMFTDEASKANRKMTAKEKAKAEKAAANLSKVAPPSASVASAEPPPQAVEAPPAPASSKKVAAARAAPEAVPEQPAMQIALKPLKSKSSRTPASVKDIESGFKRVCVSKNELGAPANLRGKCAVRNCKGGKCSYQGRKEMFDWIANSAGAL
jgi:hypothetical protein